MEQFDIYTLGSGYYLEKIFNALRMIMGDGGGNDASFVSIMKVACLGAVVVLAIRAGLNNDFKSAIKWFLGVTVLISLFLTSKATVLIHDKLPDSYGQMSAPRVVENVPWGLAFIGSITSQVGNTIAEKFDVSLAGVFNNPDYQKTGILFGSKIVEDTSKLRISDPKLKQHMHNFYKKCIVPDLNMGLRRANGYTVKELVDAPNILEFLRDHSSKARLIHITGDVQQATETDGVFGKKTTYEAVKVNGYISCHQAAGYLYSSVNYEVELRMPKLANSFIAYFAQNNGQNINSQNSANNNNSSSNEIFKSVLAGSYGIFIKNASQDAKDILLQNMAINAIGDTVNSKVYNNVTTEIMTNTAYASVSQMAQKFVPILRAVLECLFYGVFPLVLILMVTPIGLEVLKNYIFGFIYLQLWQPMYAILFCIAASWGQLYASDINSVTFATHSSIARINDEISSVAGYMLTLVPILSLFITKGMVASMGNLASSIAYIPQSTAVQNAESAVKGNYQIGTTAINTHSSDLSSSNKHDNNYSWASGMKSFSMPSGASEKLHSDGRTTLDSSAGLNNMAGLAKIDWQKAMGSRYDQAINKNISNAEHYASSTLESTGTGLSKLLGFDQNFAKGSNSYEGWNKNLTSDQRKSFDEARDYVEKFAEKHAISQQDALKISVAANGKIGGKIGIGSLQAALGISLNADAFTDASKKEDHSKLLQAGKDQRFADNLSKIESFVNSESYQENVSHNDSILESVKSDFSKAKSASFATSKAIDTVDSLQSSKANFENDSSSIGQGLSHHFAQEHINSMGAAGLDYTLRNDPNKTNQLLNQYLDQQVNKTIGNARDISKSAQINAEFNQKKSEFIEQQQNLKNDDYSKNADAIERANVDDQEQVLFSAPSGFKTNIKDKLETSGSDLKGGVAKKLDETDNKLNTESQKLDKKSRPLKIRTIRNLDQSASGKFVNSWGPFKIK